MTLPELELRFEATTTPPPPAPPEPGAPVDVHCGQVITVSTKLANDVTGCLGEGIVIGASDIVLDLNGKTVQSGLILEPGEEDALTPGIRSARPNVVIRGCTPTDPSDPSSACLTPSGTVRGFGYGVLLGPGATHNVVERLTLFGNALAGVHLFDADDGRNGNTVRNNLIEANGEAGVPLFGGTEGSTVENNTFRQNGTSVLLNDARGNTVPNNDISGIIIDPLLDSDAGIVLENSSRHNALLNNDVRDTGDAGLRIHQGSHDNRVEGGVLVRNGDAGVIVEDSDRAYITGIVSHGQSDGGVVIGNSSSSFIIDNDLRYNPSGISASDTNGLRVEGNDASNCSAGRDRAGQRHRHGRARQRRQPERRLRHLARGRRVRRQRGGRRRRPDRGQHHQRERGERSHDRRRRAHDPRQHREQQRRSTASRPARS